MQGQDQDAGNDYDTKPQGRPDQGSSHRLLQAFVGTWQVEGRTSEKTPAQGTEEYRWLDGEFFLEYRWTRNYGEQVHTGVGLIGFDSERGTYITRNFDNLGFYREYVTTVEKGLMTLRGSEERAVIGLNAGETNITIDWQRTRDGERWESLCHLVGHRLQ